MYSTSSECFCSWLFLGRQPEGTGNPMWDFTCSCLCHALSKFCHQKLLTARNSLVHMRCVWLVCLYDAIESRILMSITRQMLLLPPYNTIVDTVHCCIRNYMSHVHVCHVTCMSCKWYFTHLKINTLVIFCHHQCVFLQSLYTLRICTAYVYVYSVCSGNVFVSDPRLEL